VTTEELKPQAVALAGSRASSKSFTAKNRRDGAKAFLRGRVSRAQHLAQNRWLKLRLCWAPSN